MIDLLQDALDLQAFIEKQGWQSCFIGGLAVQRWSQPRVTRDIDAALLTGFGREEPFIDALLEHYRPRRPEAKAFALRNRVLLIESRLGNGIDISLAALPFEESAIRRATLFSFGPGLDLRTCSAEDLIVFKLFASRPLDIRDAEGVVIRHRENLDWDYIERNLRPLAEAKEAPEIMDLLASLRNS